MANDKVSNDTTNVEKNKKVTNKNKNNNSKNNSSIKGNSIKKSNDNTKIKDSKNNRTIEDNSNNKHKINKNNNKNVNNGLKNKSSSNNIKEKSNSKFNEEKLKKIGNTVIEPKIAKRKEDKLIEPKKKKNNQSSDTYIKNRKVDRINKELKEKEVKQSKKSLITDEKDFIPRKKKRKLKKKFKIMLWILLFLFIVSIIIISLNLYFNQQEKKEQEKIAKEQAALVTKISSHYGNYVLVKEDTALYRIDENNNYYEYGIVYKNSEVLLDEIEINHLTEYFYSTDLESYLKYDNLEPISELTKYNDRYKRYIPFNQNIVTKDEFSLYDDDNKVYSFKESMNFPIIIKNDDGKYYVEFNNRLLYVLKEDIKEIVNANNTNSKNASKVTTLCYHRIYNPDQHCKDVYICKSRSNFSKEMKYLKDNNYLTLTMEEMYLYLTKKIQVPKKSVVLTFDDGYLFVNAIEVLEEYQLNGTGFLKTGYFTDLSIYESNYFEVHSHTDNMHIAGTCPRETSVQQGGGILCLPEATVLKDLKTSREKLNGSIALAYPFYDYNTRAINLVKKQKKLIKTVSLN